MKATKYYKCEDCGKSFFEVGKLKRHILLTMMATKITNVKIVVTYSLDYKDWRDTSIQFMMDVKIINVNFVANYLQQQDT